MNELPLKKCGAKQFTKMVEAEFRPFALRANTTQEMRSVGNAGQPVKFRCESSKVKVQCANKLRSSNTQSRKAEKLKDERSTKSTTNGRESGIYKAGSQGEKFTPIQTAWLHSCQYLFVFAVIWIFHYAILSEDYSETGVMTATTKAECVSKRSMFLKAGRFTKRHATECEPWRR